MSLDAGSGFGVTAEGLPTRVLHAGPTRQGLRQVGGRRRRWSAAEKLGIVEETLDDRASISVVARRNGVAPNLLYLWRRLMLEGGSVAVSEDDDVTSNKVVR